MENQFSGHVMEGGGKPPILQDQYTLRRHVVIETVRKNGRIYCKLRTKGNNKSYWGAASFAGAPLQVDKHGDSDLYLWSFIPYVAPGNRNFGLYMLKNLKTGQFLYNRIEPQKVLNRRDPKRDESGPSTSPLVLNDRRFLWAFGLAKREPTDTLALPQGGWDVNAPVKLAVLCVRKKLKEPVIFTLLIGSKSPRGRALYWGQYWNDMHYYIINLNYPFFSKPGEYRIKCAGQSGVIRITEHAFTHPFREHGKDRFSLTDLFDNNLGAVGQWGHLDEWYPDPYKLWKQDLEFFPRWMWRDESDANGNNHKFEPVTDRPEMTPAEAKLALQGTWDITDRYFQNYALDGAVLIWISELYRIKAKDDPALKNEIREELAYCIGPTLKRQNPDGSWRQGFADIIQWTGTTCSLAAGLAAAVPVLKESDPALAAKALTAAEKAWRYVLLKKDDPSTWAVKGYGKLPDGSVLKRQLGAQRNLFRDSYLSLAIYLYFATENDKYKTAVEDEIRIGTLSPEGGWVGRDKRVLPGQRQCKAHRLLPALCRYYKNGAGAETRQEIREMVQPYYKARVINPAMLDGPFGTYSPKSYIHPWKFGKTIIAAAFLYDTFGAEYQEGIFLCERAVDWYFGCNPFSSSLIYGVGDDFVIDGWNSYHALGRQMGFDVRSPQKINKERQKRAKPPLAVNSPYLLGSDYNYYESEMEVSQTMELWVGMAMLDKHRKDKFGVMLFTKPKYSGRRVRLPLGRYDSGRLASCGISSENIRSLAVPENYIVTLFNGDNCRGESVTIAFNAPSLGRSAGKLKSLAIGLVGDKLPNKAECASPLNNAKSQSERVQLVWRQAAGASSYNLYLDGKLKLKHTPRTAYRPPSPLSFASGHTWRVDALNKNGITKGRQATFSVRKDEKSPIRISDSASAFQNTTFLPAARALDGKTDTFTHTGNHPGDYWELRLNKTYRITRVEITNRNGNFSRLNNCIITLYDADRNVVWKSTPIAGADGKHKIFNFDLGGKKGLFLRVGLEDGKKNGDGNHIISLAEVVVYGFNDRNYNRCE